MFVPPTIKFTEVDGMIESAYLIFPGFRADVHRARETLAFGSSLLIDIAENDLPIAIQCITRFDPKTVPALPIMTQKELETSATESVELLWGFANQMVAYHRANSPIRGKAFGPKIVDRVKALFQMPPAARTVACA
ncbi:MAG: hypothetical protein Q7R41_15035 [Phycisphaerales bacterium]|nr:hypothetical protein [Phycisphaerales bacterium]